MLHRCLRAAAPFALALAAGTAAAAAAFPPITDQERALTVVPDQPAAPAVVLFRNGELRMMDPSRQDVSSLLVVRVRLKILTEAGKEKGNVQIAHSGVMRLQDFEGRTPRPRWRWRLRRSSGSGARQPAPAGRGDLRFRPRRDRHRRGQPGLAAAVRDRRRGARPAPRRVRGESRPAAGDAGGGSRALGSPSTSRCARTASPPASSVSSCAAASRRRKPTVSLPSVPRPPPPKRTG